jgi:prevent-host-death family protein
MIKIGSYEAKTKLPELLKRVARGERIMITKHGVPVAILSPVDRSNDEEEPAQAIDELLRFREQHTLGGLSIREMIEEGRRH